MKNSKKYIVTVVCLLLLTHSGCKKLVDVPEPVNTLTTSETFSTDANATSAVVAIYNDLTSGTNGGAFDYGNGLTNYLTGLSSDEFTFSSNNFEITQFQNNNLQAIN